MTDTTDVPESEGYEPSELDVLKQRATDMGIPFSPNIGLDTLRERVNAALTKRGAPPAPMAEESDTARYNRIREEAMKLIRVRITNLNPSKRESEAEYFRAGNRVVPTITRLVPFDVETHVENILLNHIRTRQYVHVRTIKQDGKEHNEHSLRLEFQIEVLPPLTKEELETLAAEQAKRQTV